MIKLINHMTKLTNQVDRQKVSMHEPNKLMQFRAFRGILAMKTASAKQIL